MTQRQTMLSTQLHQPPLPRLPGEPDLRDLRNYLLQQQGMLTQVWADIMRLITNNEERISALEAQVAALAARQV